LNTCITEGTVGVDTFRIVGVGEVVDSGSEVGSEVDCSGEVMFVVFQGDVSVELDR
jgi:hypothetical protein